MRPAGLHAHGDLVLVIAAGGALGSVARWGLAELIPYAAEDFAWATLLANVVGCALLGLLMVFALGPWSHTRYLRPFLGVGVLGGFTTFSTYALDTRGMVDAGHPWLAFTYLAGTVVLGLFACAAGVLAGRLLLATGRRRAPDPRPQED